MNLLTASDFESTIKLEMNSSFMSYSHDKLHRLKMISN